MRNETIKIIVQAFTTPVGLKRTYAIIDGRHHFVYQTPEEVRHYMQSRLGAEEVKDE